MLDAIVKQILTGLRAQEMLTPQALFTLMVFKQKASFMRRCSPKDVVSRVMRNGPFDSGFLPPRMLFSKDAVRAPLPMKVESSI